MAEDDQDMTLDGDADRRTTRGGSDDARLDRGDSIGPVSYTHLTLPTKA